MANEVSFRRRAEVHIFAVFGVCGCRCCLLGARGFEFEASEYFWLVSFGEVQRCPKVGEVQRMAYVGASFDVSRSASSGGSSSSLNPC